MNLQLMITAQVYFAIFIWPNIYIHVNILIQNYCAMLNKIIMTLEGSRIPMHSLETQKIKKVYIYQNFGCPIGWVEYRFYWKSQNG